MPKYRMTSEAMVHTPGLVRAAIATAKTDFKYWLNVFTEGYGLPADAATALINGDAPFTLENKGDVVFEWPLPEQENDNG